MSFTRWSQSNPQAKRALAPDLGLRSWDDLDSKRKQNIWLHFVNKKWFAADEKTYQTISQFNEDYKAQSFCNHLQSHGGPHYIESRGIRFGIQSCCFSIAQNDFSHIFHAETQDVFYELISYYVLFTERSVQGVSNTANFKDLFNDISNQFGLNVSLGKEGFVLRQDKKITDEIYIPVLNLLSDPKWESVNRDLNDATVAYLKNTEKEYSTCITHTISALQAFLQILVQGEISKGNINFLIRKAQEKRLIPNDPFTTEIFRNIESVLMQERQTKGDPHPKKEYANEKTARLILNLSMIFIQHCLQP